MELKLCASYKRINLTLQLLILTYNNADAGCMECVCVCTWERVWSGGHFDTPDEVVHGNLNLVLHVLHTTPQWMEMERPIPGGRNE